MEQIYFQYCSDCHGRRGFGIVGRGPALNNPQLFGHNYFPNITQQIDQLNTEKKILHDQRAVTNLSDQQQAQIDNRLTEIENAITDINAKRDLAIKPAVDFGYDPKFPNRLKQADWKGDLASFILTTIANGRPTSVSYWPNPMPGYSETAHSDVILGQHQIEDITAYILNWDKGNNWTLDDLYAVNQFAILPSDSRIFRCLIIVCGDTINIDIRPVGTNVGAIIMQLKNTVSDAKRGNQLYHGQLPAALTQASLPCTGCHTQTKDSIGPKTNGIYNRVVQERLRQPRFSGWTPEEYLVDSIVNPSHYIVPGFKDLMVRNFGTEVLDIQDLADLVAYLKTQ